MRHDVAVKLVEPIRVGSLTAPSRVVFGPHETNLGYDRAFSDRHVAYYTRRAAGGAGVVVTEEASVHESDWPYERAPLARLCGPGWSEIAQACHGEGALVLAALGHAGGQGTSHWSQRELWAPSRVPEVNTREVPKWMEDDDIEAVIDGFGAAARLAVRSGCDGVEVNAGQYSLARQFLSGLTNHRDDRWGQDRTLFLREVLDRVRSQIGPDRVLALRLSCDELAPWAGITPEAAPELVAEILGNGGGRTLEMLTVVRGSIYSVSATRPDGHTPPGFNLELTRTISGSIPSADRPGGGPLVVAQGSIVDVPMAEAALAEFGASLVEMTRAQIADAELVVKTRRGEATRVRPATLTNQRTQVRDNRNPIVTSTSDPRSGHELDDPPVDGPGTVVPSELVEVVVVGAGPAGLEAARVAAALSHDVVVLEAGERTGGMVRTAQNMPGFERLGRLVDWLEAECRTNGVDIRTEFRADPADLVDWLTGGSSLDELVGPDVKVGGAPDRPRHLVVATGGTDGRRTYRATRAAVVMTAAEVLDSPDDVPGGTVLVWDPIGGPWGVACAELLAGRGRQVELATQDNIVGNELARSGDLAPANARLQQAGVVLHRRRILRAVKKGSAVLENRFTGEQENLRAAVVVDAGHRLPDETLWDAVHDLLSTEPSGAAAERPDPVRPLQARRRITRVGDSVAPRTIHDAILEGRRAALGLG